MLSKTNTYPWLKLGCPECSGGISPEALHCENGHQFYERQGVVSLLNKETSTWLLDFLDKFEAYREKKGLRSHNPMWFRQLPYGPIAKGNFEWRYRQAGWEIINQRLEGQPRQKILDIGAWNGWLSHRLVAAGHQVVAVDYFVDPLDGLGAMTHYDVAWPAIQMDLENLTNLPVAFDLIIVNHCLQFFATPFETLRQAQQLLIQDGEILVIGLAFFADPRKQIGRVKRYRAELIKHGVDFFKPMKGYLDLYDRKHLQQKGFEFHPYQQLWKANLRSQIDPTRPRYEFGLYVKDK